MQWGLATNLILRVEVRLWAAFRSRNVGNSARLKDIVLIRGMGLGGSGSQMIVFDIISTILLAFLLFWTIYNGSIIYAGVRNKRKHAPSNTSPIEETPKFSIIVPTKDEEVVIGRCLNSFLELDYPADKVEVIVVDGNSADNTCNICQDFSNKVSRRIQNHKRASVEQVNPPRSTSHWHTRQGKSWGFLTLTASQRKTFSEKWLPTSVTRK